MNKTLCKILSFILCIFCLTNLFACKSEEKKPIKTKLDCLLSNNQVEALANVAYSLADVALVDRYEADYVISSFTDMDTLTVIDIEGISFAKEQFCFITKKGSNFADYINAALYYIQENSIDVNFSNNKTGQLYYNMDLYKIADLFGLSNMVLTIPEPSATLYDTPSGAYEDIVNRKMFKIGWTCPPDSKGLNRLDSLIFRHDNAHTDGAEMDILKSVATAMGFYTESGDTFVLPIEWDNVEQSLNNGTIDVVAGAICDTAEIREKFSVTYPHMENSYVLVVRKTDINKFSSLDSLKSAKFSTAKGSEGESLINGFLKEILL